MNHRLARIGLVAVLAATGLLSVVPPASANTVTIGSSLGQPSNVNGISTGSITVQQGQVGGSGPHPLTSPANGVVTEWAVMSRDANAIYSLRILRPTGPTTYTVTGTAVAPTVDPGGSTTILRYPASLPITQGEAIGITPGGDSDAGIPQANTPALTGNVMAVSVGGAPDGGTASFTPMEGHELLLQATVQFCSVPALKGLKRAAAQQALATADCALGTVKKKTLKRSKKTKKKKGKVLNQSLAPGSTAAPGTPVDLKIAGLRKKKKG